jgi:hypothetical protein
MLRGIAGLLGVVCLLTGCGASGNPKTLALLTDPVEYKYLVGSTVKDFSFSLAADRGIDVQLRPMVYPAKIRMNAKCHDLTDAKQFTAVIGPMSDVWITPENWLRVESGWVYVVIPHNAVDDASAALWNPSHYPWVIGSSVRAGVHGFTGSDHVILRRYPGIAPLTRTFFSATGSDGTASIGKYLIVPPDVPTVTPHKSVTPASNYLEYTGGSTASEIPLPTAVSDVTTFVELETIRGIAAVVLPI